MKGEGGMPHFLHKWTHERAMNNVKCEYKYHANPDRGVRCLHRSNICSTSFWNVHWILMRDYLLEILSFWYAIILFRNNKVFYCIPILIYFIPVSMSTNCTTNCSQFAYLYVLRKQRVAVLFVSMVSQCTQLETYELNLSCRLEAMEPQNGRKEQCTGEIDFNIVQIDAYMFQNIYLKRDVVSLSLWINKEFIFGKYIASLRFLNGFFQHMNVEWCRLLIWQVQNTHNPRHSVH